MLAYFTTTPFLRGLCLSLPLLISIITIIQQKKNLFNYAGSAAAIPWIQGYLLTYEEGPGYCLKGHPRNFATASPNLPF